MKRLDYAGTGIDIDATNSAKRRMAAALDVGDARVLNRFGAFAAIVEGRFATIRDPVLVLKMEEPGSKQELAIQLDQIESLCCDLINHLVNDVAVMGAHPAYVLDCIVCGRLDSTTVERLVAGMAVACRNQGCVLVGGETSVQPGVVPNGSFVLSATAVGVAERSEVIDGSRISAGDAVIAVASDGLHTNGFTLVRALLRERPEVADVLIGGERFLDGAMRPHLAYYPVLRGLFQDPAVHGLAHITGGGLRDNIARILPPSLMASIDLGLLRLHGLFEVVRTYGNVTDEDMLRTFNLGCGLVVVCAADAATRIRDHFESHQLEAWQIGEVVEGKGMVRFYGELAWTAQR